MSEISTVRQNAGLLSGQIIKMKTLIAETTRKKKKKKKEKKEKIEGAHAD